MMHSRRRVVGKGHVHMALHRRVVGAGGGIGVGSHTLLSGLLVAPFEVLPPACESSLLFAALVGDGPSGFGPRAARLGRRGAAVCHERSRRSRAEASSMQMSLRHSGGAGASLGSLEARGMRAAKLCAAGVVVCYVRSRATGVELWCARCSGSARVEDVCEVCEVPSSRREARLSWRQVVEERPGGCELRCARQRDAAARLAQGCRVRAVRAASDAVRRRRDAERGGERNNKYQIKPGSAEERGLGGSSSCSC